ADPTLTVPTNGGTVADMGYKESDLTEVEESQLPEPYEAETPSGTVTISIPQDAQSRRFIGKPQGLGAQIFASLAGEDITVTAPGTTPTSIKLTQEKPLLTSASRGMFYFGTTGTATTVTMTTSGGTPNQFVVHARGETPSLFLDDLMVRARNPSTNALLGEVPVTVVQLNLDNGTAGFRGHMFTANDGEVTRTLTTVPPIDQMEIIFPTVAMGTDNNPGIEAELKKSPLINDKTPGEIETSPLKTDATGTLVVRNSGGTHQGPTLTVPFTKFGGANPDDHWLCNNANNAKDSGGGLGPNRKEGKYKNCAGANQGNDNKGCVEMWDGEEVERVSLLSLSGRGIDFDLTAKYRSKAANLRPFRLTDFGNDWTIDYIDERLIQDGNNVIRMSSRGRGDIYRTLADQGQPGVFVSPMEFFTKIRTLGNGDVVIRDFDGEQRTYKAFTDANIPGRLIRQEDRNGNFLTFLYSQIDPNDQVTGDEKYVLTTVTDSMGRDIRFCYFARTVQPEDAEGFDRITTTDGTDPDKYGLLAQVSDFRREVNDPDEPRTNATPDGRTVKFDYYIAADAGGNVGDLKSITSPTVENTPNGNDFDEGKTTVFTY
ncbi:MAG: hypothetical protein AAB403_13630, partial [Planctomycetota bacterium]